MAAAKPNRKRIFLSRSRADRPAEPPRVCVAGYSVIVKECQIGIASISEGFPGWILSTDGQGKAFAPQPGARPSGGRQQDFRVHLRHSVQLTYRTAPWRGLPLQRSHVAYHHEHLRKLPRMGRVRWCTPSIRLAMHRAFPNVWLCTMAPTLPQSIPEFL